MQALAMLSTTTALTQDDNRCHRTNYIHRSTIYLSKYLLSNLFKTLSMWPLVSHFSELCHLCHSRLHPPTENEDKENPQHGSYVNIVYSSLHQIAPCRKLRGREKGQQRSWEMREREMGEAGRWNARKRCPGQPKCQAAFSRAVLMTSVFPSSWGWQCTTQYK